MSNNAIKTGLVVGTIAALAVGHEAIAEVEPLVSPDSIEALPDVIEVTALSSDEIIDPGVIETADIGDKMAQDAGLQESAMSDQVVADYGTPSA